VEGYALNDSPEKLAYTVNEFCKAFGVSRTHFYEQTKSGLLKVRKAGRRTLVRAEDAKEWLNSLPEGCQ
jgi:excisionase family DNA binding protein